MTTRRSLPLFGATPTVDEGQRWKVEQARQKLGGRADTDDFAGTLVTVELPSGVREVGVVVYADEAEVDVWRVGDRVRRTSRSRVSATVDGVVERVVHAVADDVRVFASLVEGMPVWFHLPDGSRNEGTLFEKCRYGGLVARSDGSVLAVGFRRLSPRGAEA